jgi:hypothetical protein
MNAPTPAASFEIAQDFDPLLVFVARAEARAILFGADEFDLHEAVDPLQLYAEESGLVDRIGQDAVQQILAHAFRSST